MNLLLRRTGDNMDRENRRRRSSDISQTDQDFYLEKEEQDKQMRYDMENEMDIIRDMQKCQRNYNLGIPVKPAIIDYLLWIARNTPSKQFEAYYDVHWSADRLVINDLYKWVWGSTHTRRPPSCWRNTQMNAPFYMTFVMKQPDSLYNCDNDGKLQAPSGPSRWENSIVQVGMGMALVMQAANRLGLQTGPHKLIDLGPDYKGYWDKRLGIEKEVDEGKKKLIFGLGIGYETIGVPRYMGIDTELALGASNGQNNTVLDERHPDWEPKNADGELKRKVKIVDIRGRAGEKVKDPYGNVHTLPESHEVKINSWRNRRVESIEIK